MRVVRDALSASAGSGQGQARRLLRGAAGAVAALGVSLVLPLDPRLGRLLAALTLLVLAGLLWRLHRALAAMDAEQQQADHAQQTVLASMREQLGREQEVQAAQEARLQASVQEAVQSAVQSALEADQASRVQLERQAERVRHESRAFRQTLDQLAMVCETSPEGDIVEVSEAFCQASGYRREELLGRNPRLLGSGEHDAFFWVAVWQTLLHGEPWSGAICNRRKDGELYWLQCVIAPVLHDDGQLDRYMALAYDITEAKRHEQALTLSTERYNLAIEGSNDGLWERMNVQEDAEWWSPQVYRLLGYARDELEPCHTTIEGLMHPDDKSNSAVALQRSADQSGAIDVEYRLRVKSGEYRWFRVRARTYFDDFGQPTRMAGTIQDVHDRVQAQAALSAYGKQLAAIFSLSPDGFVSFNAEGKVWYVSPAFERLTGLSANALLGLDELAFGRRFFERVVPHTQVFDLESLKQFTAADDEDAEGRRAVVELLPPGRCNLELRISRGDAGTVSQLLHVRDVTHETEVEQMKSAFLSMAAHELRTPMASIYGFAELLLTRDYAPERQKELLSRIYRQSESMTGIINELLDLARIEDRQGKEFEYGAHDFALLVQQVISDFKRPEGRDPPHFESPAEPALVWVDRQKLQQAVLNVLSNAYKYSPDGGPVELRLTRGGEGAQAWWTLAVQDHGIGLSPDDLKRVGERFFRADKSGAIPGTGLGVTIVREILSLMGGRMDMHSELGAGTCVSLQLPAAGHSRQGAALTAPGADTAPAPPQDPMAPGTARDEAEPEGWSWLN